MKRFVVGLAVIGVALLAVGVPSARAAGMDDMRAQLAQMVAQLNSMLSQMQGMVGAPAVLGVTSKVNYLTLEEVRGTPKVSCTLPVLKPKTSSNSVSLAQLLLKQEGSYPEGFVTGYYGKLTQAAVERFQTSHGFDKVGFVDSATAKALTELAGKFYPEQCAPQTGVCEFAQPPAGCRWVGSVTYPQCDATLSCDGGNGLPTSTAITVTSPAAGETWRIGERRTIAWTPGSPTYTPAAAPRVNITLNAPRPACLDMEPRCMISENSPYVIAKNVVNNGSYAWSIPQSLPQSYRGAAQITVTQIKPAAMGRSGAFTISSATTTPTSTVSLDVQLAATPTSGTYQPGQQDIPLAGFSFRAVNQTVRLDALRVSATAIAGMLRPDEVQSLALYDGVTRVSSFMSLDESVSVRFSNLNYSIPAGVTKTLTLRGNLSMSANRGDVYKFFTAAADQSTIVAYDASGNLVRITGTPMNQTGTVRITVAGASGDVSAVAAPRDTESEEGIVVAGRENFLSKIRFTATGEDMRVNRMQLLVNDRNDASYRTNAAADEVPVVRLYDTNGATVGLAGGYTVQASGDNSGVVVIENLGWNIPRDTSKTLVVKGVLQTIANGADSGAAVYAHLMDQGFEAQGAASIDTTIQRVLGREKVVYKTKPTITVASTGATLGATLTPVIRFTVAADSAESVSLKKVQVRIVPVGARVIAADVQPGASGNVTLRPLGGSNLNILSAYSGPTAQGMQNVEIPSGSTGYVTLFFNTEEIIAAGSSKTYELSVTFADVVPNQATAATQVFRAETMRESARSVRYLESESSETSTFIWSDNSATGHSEQTNDWSNGVYVKMLPSDPVSIRN